MLFAFHELFSGLIPMSFTCFLCLCHVQISSVQARPDSLNGKYPKSKYIIYTFHVMNIPKKFRWVTKCSAQV